MSDFNPCPTCQGQRCRRDEAGHYVGPCSTCRGTGKVLDTPPPATQPKPPQRLSAGRMQFGIVKVQPVPFSWSPIGRPTGMVQGGRRFPNPTDIGVSMHTSCKPVPRSINGNPVLAHRPATSAHHEICIVVLCRRGAEEGYANRRGEPEYITWTFNLQCPGASGGHYGMDLEKAAVDFYSRHEAGMGYSILPPTSKDELDALRDAYSAGTALNIMGRADV